TRESLSPGGLLGTALEFKRLGEALPGQVHDLLGNLSSNRFRIAVDAIDEAELIVGIQKIANRITVGLITAAMIIGAAVIMHVDSSWRIWGYPGLAMLMFLFAAFTGGGLVLNIFWSDISSKKDKV